MPMFTYLREEPAVAKVNLVLQFELQRGQLFVSRLERGQFLELLVLLCNLHLTNWLMNYAHVSEMSGRISRIQLLSSPLDYIRFVDL
ncbi:hypothetical protein L1987_16966 [Smallanthus sonchifolius]|uniref:Uncharacterized protein n=1 Tax=Smallanthus sonchifolius TaxID=185202 RepID=A0ACB9IVI5_9ASTR|nr:hypothetical protein L1987_16966 [Smallanthus sonchifolius]